MATIRQMYSGFYRNYRTQYSNGQLFRNTQKNLQTAKSDLNKTTQKITSDNSDVLSAVKNLVDSYSGGRYSPYGLLASQLSSASMYNGGAALKMNTLAGIGNLFSHWI